MNRCPQMKDSMRPDRRTRELDRQLLRIAARMLPIDRDLLRQFICGTRRRDTHVAQPVERAAVNRVYGGSNPSVGALNMLSSANGSGDLVLSQGMRVQLPPGALKDILLPSSNRQDARFSAGEREFESLREC